MKKIILTLTLLFVTTLNVYANEIKDIQMDIFITDAGDAHITETWKTKINEGTEGYKPYYNLGTSVIRDFTVEMNNKPYIYENSWNINRSLDDKAYSNGLIKEENKTELVWGISSYGTNTYKLKYTITNFVSSLNDSDIVYWTLIPYELSSKPQNVNIKIRSNHYFEDTIDVWGYGNYGGTAYVYDGIIEMNSDGKLDASEYMTILVNFPKGIFNPVNKIDEEFNYYLDMAEENAEHYTDNNSKFLALIFFIYIAAVTLIVIIIKNSGIKNKNFKKEISKGKFDKDLNYFREIPCDKDIYYGYFLSDSYNLNKNKNDLLGAVILSWVKKGYVTVEKAVVKKLLKEKEETHLHLHKDKIDLSGYELKMFNYMLSASGDGILESKEFEKYCAKNYEEIIKWFEDVIKIEREKAVSKLLLLKEKKLKTTYKETIQIYEEAKKVAGLKKFLNEFSSIEDKRAIEVHLWDEYLMFAQIFGIAKEVAKEFKRLYPDVITDVDYQSAMYIHMFSTTGTKSAINARTKAAAYSAGGGGFSSGGGGGGSFGGGGGGGGFR